jgi:hypothetical protein
MSISAQYQQVSVNRASTEDEYIQEPFENYDHNEHNDRNNNNNHQRNRSHDSKHLHDDHKYGEEKVSHQNNHSRNINSHKGYK